MSPRTVLPLAVCALIAAAVGTLVVGLPAGATGNSIESPDIAVYVDSLALDGAGNPVVSYAGDAGLKVLHCNDPNCAGADESIEALPASGGSLRLDASGNPVLAAGDAIGNLILIHCNDANCAGGDESVSPPIDFGISLSLALDGAGNPVVSYHVSSPDFDLKVLHCNDPNCAGGDESITAPDTEFFTGEDTSLALDGAGNPVVGYRDRTEGALKVLHCNDANCAGGDDSITSPETETSFPAITPPFLSLALDGAGNPVLAYHDDDNGDLKVLHCNDPNCAGGDESITRPHMGLNAGAWTSLALDGAGNPVVSYLGDAGLQVLHCNDPNCAGGGESITAPDSTFPRGTSLGLDGAGNPVVGYYDLTNGDLKLLHCSDPNCTGVKGGTPTDTPTGPSPTPSDTPTPTNTPALPTATSTPEKATGDVNDDGQVNAVDAALILQLGAGLVGSLPNEPSADVDLNGSINSIDASLILQFVAGIIPGLPP